MLSYSKQDRRTPIILFFQSSAPMKISSVSKIQTFIHEIDEPQEGE